MSTQNQKPINPNTSSLESNTGFSQRTFDIFHQNREIRAANGENPETVVSVTIPLSMKEKVNSLCQWLGLSTNNLLNSSIHSIIRYSEKKKIKIREIKGYPKEKKSNDSATQKQKIEFELSGKAFEELKMQKLLPDDVSECAILGLDMLYIAYQQFIETE